MAQRCLNLALMIIEHFASATQLLSYGNLKQIIVFKAGQTTFNCDVVLLIVTGSARGSRNAPSASFIGTRTEFEKIAHDLRFENMNEAVTEDFSSHLISRHAAGLRIRICVWSHPGCQV
jgi:hypothetical protein